MFIYNFSSILLLRSHQASQQTNFGCVCYQPGLCATEARLIWDFLMYVQDQTLLRLQVIKRFRGLEELRPSKWHWCGRENPISCREPHFCERRVWKQVKVAQIPMTKAYLFLRIFEAIPGTLKCPSPRDYPHAGECITALYVIIYFLANMLFYHMIRYWFTHSCGKIKRYNACETSSKFSGENFGHLQM